jgi:hypothetical protein
MADKPELTLSQVKEQLASMSPIANYVFGAAAEEMAISSIVALNEVIQGDATDTEWQMFQQQVQAIEEKNRAYQEEQNQFTQDLLILGPASRAVYRADVAFDAAIRS